MDIELSAEDIAFREDVRGFFKENRMEKGADYFSWRNDWFAKAKEKGGWDVPNGQKNLVDQVGPQLNTTYGSKKRR
jgi:hypothetical protein